MKETILKSDYAAILKAAQGAEISGTRLEKAVSFYSLPKQGKFVEVLLIEDTDRTEGRNMSHLALRCESGEMISLSRLQALCHKGTKEEAEFKRITRSDSKWFNKLSLVAQPVNPALSGNQARVAANLVGKEFQSEAFDGLTLSFGDGTGYEKKADAVKALEIKTYYRVEIL